MSNCFICFFQGPAPIPPSNYNYGNPPSFHNPVVQQSMCPYSNYNTQERSEPSTSSKYANYNDQNYNDEWDKYKKKPDTQYPSSRKVWPKRDYDHPRGDHKSDYGREARPHQESRRRSKSPHDRDRSNRNYDRNDEDERRHKRYRRNESPDKFHNNHRQSSSARSEYNRPRDRSDSVASSSSRFSRSASVRSSTQSRKSRSKSPTNKLSSAPSSLALVKQRRLTEREALLEKYRQNFCATSQDMEKRMGELSAMGTEGIIENERKIWTRTAPADLYYCRDESNLKIMKGTDKLKDLCDNFKELLINRAANARASQVFNFSSIVNKKLNYSSKTNKLFLCLSLSTFHLREKRQRLVCADTSLRPAAVLLREVTVLRRRTKTTGQWKN